MLHCFGFVFPSLGKYMYMYNRYKIENKLSLSRIELRIEIRKTEIKRFTQDWFLNNFTQTYSCNNIGMLNVHELFWMLQCNYNTWG